ncbi:MAG TPA: histidine--tRNA ligase [Candidatus Acidoferrum sp.]|nr:histidine--tRNA ligase [Candidatus Acidoferrum sp.]
MAEKREFQAIKGTRDLLPPETELWNRVEQTAREVFGTFGFGEIRLPIFETTELFARAVGGETDIVSKEMYSFEDHGWIELEQYRSALIVKSMSPGLPSEFTHFERSVLAYVDILSKRISAGDVPKTPENEKALVQVRRCLDEMNRAGASFVGTQSASDEIDFENSLKGVKQALLLFRFGDVLSLRPEATASVCRAYIEHGMQALAQPVKLYYMGPMFRRERPQKGRYRQFYQIGAEVLEATTPNQDASKTIGKDAATDAEAIEMVMVYFARLGLEGVQLDINSIGHSAADCRRGYVEKLKVALEKVKDKLGADSQRRIETNPLRVLDSKLESEQAIIEKLPRIADHLCADCAKHYAEVKRQLELRGVAYQENWRLVRGLDYYMRTTFEITARGLGSQNAVCGGGRYDGLVELLGGPPTKGIGFAIGEDRVILSLQEAGKGSVAQRRDVYIAWMGEKTLATAIRAAQDLRQAGFRVELPPVEQKFGKALGQADKLGARYALILGEDEVASGEWTLKTLADGTQAKYSEAGLMEFLRQTRTLSS